MDLEELSLASLHPSMMGNTRSYHYFFAIYDVRGLRLPTKPNYSLSDQHHVTWTTGQLITDQTDRSKFCVPSPTFKSCGINMDTCALRCYIQIARYLGDVQGHRLSFDRWSVETHAPKLSFNSVKDSFFFTCFLAWSSSYSNSSQLLEMAGQDCVTDKRNLRSQICVWNKATMWHI